MQQNSVEGQQYAAPLETGDVTPNQDGGPGGNNTFTNPPRVSPSDLRAVRDVHTNPHLQFYDPNSLHFPDAQGPLFNRTSGGYFMLSPMSQVVHSGQSVWDRSKEYEAGPVRDFFRRILFDNRTKHL